MPSTAASEGLSDCSNCASIIESQPAKDDGTASRILLQIPTQESQIATPGPPSSFATSVSAFLQNEQRKRRLSLRAMCASLSVKNTLTDQPVKECLTDGHFRAAKPRERLPASAVFWTTTIWGETDVRNHSAYRFDLAPGG